MAVGNESGAALHALARAFPKATCMVGGREGAIWFDVDGCRVTGFTSYADVDQAVSRLQERAA